LESRTISSDIRVLPLEEAIRKVLLDYDAFFFYDASAAPARLRTVWVFSKGSASDIRPVRPEQCASSKDIETALRESDPAARSLAYEALLERPDRHSRMLITEALRGIREPDAGVRERLLSMALSRGFELSPEVLADLARADASENIRLMAVDALAQHPSAKQIAEAALTDPSAAVRARAKEVLSEVSRGNERHQAETERPEQQ
jgi:HEAT repeat protein